MRLRGERKQVTLSPSVSPPLLCCSRPCTAEAKQNQSGGGACRGDDQGGFRGFAEARALPRLPSARGRAGIGAALWARGQLGFTCRGWDWGSAARPSGSGRPGPASSLLLGLPRRLPSAPGGATGSGHCTCHAQSPQGSRQACRTCDKHSDTRVHAWLAWPREQVCLSSLPANPFADRVSPRLHATPTLSSNLHAHHVWSPQGHPQQVLS